MTDYYTDDNPPKYEKVAPFRFVVPYEHCYRTRAKGRWLKRKLIEALVQEFKAYDKEYYVNAIVKGKVLVNDAMVKTDYIIQNGDTITHFALRNEPPILDIPVKIVHEDDDYLVVSKPPSMIVHTGGGYHFNTLMGILYYEHGYRNLHVLHRLDRLTSGLLLFAKRKEVAQVFHTALGKCTIGKTYLARVTGDFPETIKESKRQIYCVSMKDAIFECCDDEQAMTLQAKPAETHFTKVWYDEATGHSLLKCHPVTGKTHQIRVHLKDLGYPIINDVGYGGKMVGNHIIAKYFDKLDMQAIKQKIAQHEEPQQPTHPSQPSDDCDEQMLKKIKTNDGTATDLKQQHEPADHSAFKIYEWDYKEHPLEIYLHSYRYQFGDLVFETTLPYWSEKILPIL